MLSLIYSRCFIILLCLLSVLLLESCGFYFRGYKPDATQSSTPIVLQIVLQADNADRMQQYFTDKFVSDELKLVTLDKAEYIVQFADESMTREILSLSPETGKVREYNLVYELSVSITDPSDASVLDSDLLRFEQDYIFDTNALLATEREEETVEQDLLKQAAEAIVRRLRTIASQ